MQSHLKRVATLPCERLRARMSRDGWSELPRRTSRSKQFWKIFIQWC